jgi:hypothetical protein
MYVGAPAYGALGMRGGNMMKNYKIMTLMLVVTLLTGAVLSGCEAGRPLFGFYGDMVKAWEKSYDRDSPDALTVYIEHDGVAEAPQAITSAQITTRYSTYSHRCA